MLAGREEQQAGAATGSAVALPADHPDLVGGSPDGQHVGHGVAGQVEDRPRRLAALQIVRHGTPGLLGRRPVRRHHAHSGPGSGASQVQLAGPAEAGEAAIEEHQRLAAGIEHAEALPPIGVRAARHAGRHLRAVLVAVIRQLARDVGGVVPGLGPHLDRPPGGAVGVALTRQQRHAPFACHDDVQPPVGVVVAAEGGAGRAHQPHVEDSRRPEPARPGTCVQHGALGVQRQDVAVAVAVDVGRHAQPAPAQPGQRILAGPGGQRLGPERAGRAANQQQRPRGPPHHHGRAGSRISALQRKALGQRAAFPGGGERPVGRLRHQPERPPVPAQQVHPPVAGDQRTTYELFAVPAAGGVLETRIRPEQIALDQALLRAQVRFPQRSAGPGVHAVQPSHRTQGIQSAVGDTWRALRTPTADQAVIRPLRAVLAAP